MKLHQIAIIAVISLALFAGTALAQTGPGTTVVRNANDQIRKLLQKKAKPGSAEEKKLAKDVTTSVRDFLDIDDLGKRSLVDHWDKLTDAQKQEFQRLLRQLIEKNYVKGLRANLKYKVTYTGEKANKNGTLVVSTEIETKRRGRPYTVDIDYVLQKQDGKWRAFDVKTDGVGLVKNYRAQFNKLIGKHGFDGLLKRMRKKAAKL